MVRHCNAGHRLTLLEPSKALSITFLLQCLTFVTVSLHTTFKSSKLLESPPRLVNFPSCPLPSSCSVRRTQVLDDESDYFATDSNTWLSPNERAALRKKEEELRELKHASRKDRKITLDFAGRTVVEETGNLKQYYEK